MSDPAAPEQAFAKRDIRRKRSLLAQTALRLVGRTGAVVGLIWIGITALLAVLAPLLANSRPIFWQVRDEAGNWASQFPAFQYLSPQDVLLLVGFVLLAALACCCRAGGRLLWVWVMPMAVAAACSMIFHLIQAYGGLSAAYQLAAQELLELANTPGVSLKGYEAAKSKALWDIVRFWLLWPTVGLTLAGLFVLGLVKLRRSPLWLGVALALSVLLAGVLLAPLTRVKPRPDVAYDAYRVMLADGRAKNALFTLVPYSPDDLQIDAPVKPTSLPPGPSPSESDIAADMVSSMEQRFGIRLYTLDQVSADGKITPTPKTIKAAYAAADRLWQAYQQQNKGAPGYDAQQAQALNGAVRNDLDAYANTEIGLRYHPMGTTWNGEDLASRMIYGSRIALVIGFIATGIAVFIGVIVGGLLGYFAGWVDLIGLRLVEIFASIPVIMLLIMIVAFYGRSLILMMVVLGLTGWVGYAYFVRAEFLKLRNMDYVMAARAAGTPLYLILFRHMLPNGIAPVLVGASFGIAGAIMTEATLSFIGLGLENEPSWGQMLNQARQGGSFSWWLAIYPGSAIFLTVFAYNLIGEALRDVIDPRAAK